MKPIFQRTIYAFCLTALSTVFALTEAHQNGVSSGYLPEEQTVAADTTQRLLSLLDDTPVADFL